MQTGCPYAVIHARMVQSDNQRHTQLRKKIMAAMYSYLTLTKRNWHYQLHLIACPEHQVVLKYKQDIRKVI